MFPDDLKIRFVRGGSTDKHKRSFGMCVACNVDSRRCQKLRVYNLTVVLSRKVLETGAIIGVRVRKDFRRSYQWRTVTPPSTHIYIYRTIAARIRLRCTNKTGKREPWRPIVLITKSKTPRSSISDRNYYRRAIVNEPPASKYSRRQRAFVVVVVVVLLLRFYTDGRR